MSQSKKSFGGLIIKFVNNKRRIVALYFVLVIGGGLVYAAAENKSVWDGTWWAVISSLSIGYGDQYPVTVIGRIDGIVVGVFGIMIIVPIIIGLIIKDVLEDIHQFTDFEQKIFAARLLLIEEGNRVIIENQRVINHNVSTLGDMLAKIGEAVGVDLSGEQANLKNLVSLEKYEELKENLYILENFTEKEAVAA